MVARARGFVRLPSSWIRRGDLTAFHGGGQLGLSTTALKLYISILSQVRSDDRGPGYGCAQVSFTWLEEVADVARAMIRPALEFLDPWIRTQRSRSGNVYEVVDFTTTPGQWARLPSEYIVEGRRLRAFPARSPLSLAALKMYLYLLERCERNADHAMVTYPAIRANTGVSQNDIPRATVPLSAADLIRTSSPRRLGRFADTNQNVYHLLGFGPPLPKPETAETDADINFD